MPLPRGRYFALRRKSGIKETPFELRLWGADRIPETRYFRTEYAVDNWIHEKFRALVIRKEPVMPSSWRAVNQWLYIMEEYEQ